MFILIFAQERKVKFAVFGSELTFKNGNKILGNSGVARAFPGDQNEEENEENLRKYERNYRKMRKD